jgi:hypothetical protein
MLLGLVILSLNLQHPLELILVGIFFFWERAAISSIVLKNLVAHRERNRYKNIKLPIMIFVTSKTTIMYALSLGFIIFISVAYSMTIDSFNFQIQQSNGVFLGIYAKGGRDDSGNAKKIDIIAELEVIIGNDFCVKVKSMAINDPYIENYAWISAPLSEVVSDVEDVQFTNIGNVTIKYTFFTL